MQIKKSIETADPNLLLSKVDMADATIGRLTVIKVITFLSHSYVKWILMISE